MYRKLKQAPTGLISREVLIILVLADFIDGISIYGYFCHGFIRALIDVFVKIFDSLNGATEFNIKVGIILLRQVRVVRYDPRVV